MKYIAVLDTDDFKDFEFFEDGNGKYLHAIDASAINGEWIYLPFKPLVEQEQQTFKWCTDCKEYDQEKHCCYRFSKVIRDTVEEMKQESKTGYISIDDVMSVFDDFMCGEVDENGTETFLEMLKDKAGK
jgi:hypothetical protein